MTRVGEALVCETCGATYAIIDGIPRFSTSAMAYWDDVYLASSSDDGLYARVRERLIYFGSQLDAVPRGGTVVEVGCGRAAFVHHLRHAGGKQFRYVGIDLSAGPLSQIPLDEGDVVAQADVNNLPVAANSADAIICLGVLMFLPGWPLILEQIFTILKPGGTLFLVEGIVKRQTPLFAALSRRAFRGQVRHDSVIAASALREQLEALGTVLLWRVNETPLKHVLLRAAALLPRRSGPLYDAITAVDRAVIATVGRWVPDMTGRGVAVVARKDG